jgi:cytochrome d ubiquinol oxidase subunit II
VYGQTFIIPLFPLLCGVAMVAGYALLGSAWLIYKTGGITQTFGRKVNRAAWLLTMATFALVCFWTPLSVTRVARRWFTFPGSVLFIALAVAMVTVSIAFWRSIWNSRSDARPLQLAVAMTFLAFVGFAGTIWPYALPYRISIVEGAADLSSIRFALIGIVVVLPMVLTYQLYRIAYLRARCTTQGFRMGHRCHRVRILISAALK